MKKIFALPILLCCCGLYAVPSFAGNCKPRHLTGSEIRKSNEYLYPSIGHYNAQTPFACEKGGNTDNCDEGTKVAVSGAHSMGDGNGELVNYTGAGIYECHIDSSDDYWGMIDAGSLNQCAGNISNYHLVAKLDNNRISVYCKNIEQHGTTAWCVDKDGTNLCFKSECADCDKKTDDNVTPPTPPANPTGCARFRAYPERYKCCIAGNQTKWIGEVATGHCECKGEGTKWKSELGQCVGANGEPEMQKCNYSLKANAKCPNGAIINKGTKIELNVPKSKGTCDEFKNNVREFSNDFKELIWEYCDISGVQPTTPQNTPVITGPSQAEIEAAKSSLNAFFQTAESDASVWKDADGNFNTARLASDLTAGVVLGTVGGVVSGVVIKKKQVEKGFDALNCSVGGQKIANWGDTFEVGFRR